MSYETNILTGDTRYLPGRRKPRLSFSVWLNTDGGRKCPMCGKYARQEELGWIGSNSPGCHIDAYGHLPGFGCNK